MNIRVALDWKRNLYQRKLPVDPRFGITWLNDKIVQFVYTKADSTETIYEISKGNIHIPTVTFRYYYKHCVKRVTTTMIAMKLIAFWTDTALTSTIEPAILQES